MACLQCYQEEAREATASRAVQGRISYVLVPYDGWLPAVNLNQLTIRGVQQ